MIAFYRGVSLISKLIRFQTWSTYSHVALITQQANAYEAWSRKGVTISADPWTHHTPLTPIDFYGVALPPRARANVYAFIQKRLGARYDYRAVLRFLRRPRFWQDNKTKYFCSELIYAAYVDSGYPLLSTKDPSRISPALLHLSPFIHYVGTAKSPLGLANIRMNKTLVAVPQPFISQILDDIPPNTPIWDYYTQTA